MRPRTRGRATDCVDALRLRVALKLARTETKGAHLARVARDHGTTVEGLRARARGGRGINDAVRAMRAINTKDTE